MVTYRDRTSSDTCEKMTNQTLNKYHYFNHAYYEWECDMILFRNTYNPKT